MSILQSPHIFFHCRRPATLALCCLGLAILLAPLSGWADPVLDRADELLKNGRVDAATAIYQQALSLHPTSLPAELALARIAMRRFEYPRAQDILQKALAQHPDSAETAAMMGHLFQLWANSPVGKANENLRDYHALAQEHFRQAQTMGPNDPAVLTYLAEWQIQQGDLVTAERNLQKALQRDPNYIPALQAMTRYFIKTRDLTRAKNVAMQTLDLDPVNSDSYFLVAQMLGLANHPAEAVKYAEKSEQLDYGHSPERDYFLASQYEKLGELPKAAQYYETLLTYTPRESQVWMKLGDLYDRLGQSGQSLSAYRQALAIQPDLASSLLTQARESTRAERIDPALAQWNRILTLQAELPDARNEALDNIASLHYLYTFLHAGQPHPALQKGLDLFDGTAEQDGPRQLDILKLRLCMHAGEPTPDIRQLLVYWSASPDPAVAGEAAFLMDDLKLTAEKLDLVDGLSAEDYTRLADRLLMDQELVYSKAFYQRANELAANPQLVAAMKRIAAKQALAQQKVDQGNALFNQKDYKGALQLYEEARKIDRQWDNVYLRLGDTYEMTHQPINARYAYEHAIALSPSLLESQGFAKNYRKLAKKTATK